MSDVIAAGEPSTYWIAAEASVDQLTAALRNAHRAGVLVGCDELTEVALRHAGRYPDDPELRVRTLAAMVAVAVDRLARQEAL